MRLPPITALALATGLGLGIAAHAQTPPPPTPPPPPGGPEGRAWGQHDRGEHREARRAQHLKALHDVLAIRPDQESAFQAFAAATSPEGAGPDHSQWGPGARRGGDRPDGDRAGAATTPERLDVMLRRFDERIARIRAALERRATATKTLYAALSPEQQRTLDALPRLSGRGAWGGREGMHGGRPERGPGGPGPGAPGGVGAGD